MSAADRMPTMRAALLAPVALALGLLAGPAALAQSPGQLVPPSLAPQPQRTPTGITLPTPPETGAPAGADKVRLTIGDIRVEGGDPALAAATEAVTAPLRGRTVSAAAIYTAAAAIEAAYAERGYFLTRVVVPPQDVRHGGTLKLRVVEGFIEGVDASALSPAVRSRVEAVLAPAIGERQLTLSAFERRLLLAGEVPGLALRSTLVPGSGSGAVRLVLQGEHRPVSGEISAYNSLSRPLGRTALSFNASANSILGFGEQVYATAVGAPSAGWFTPNSARRLFAAGLIAPLGTDGLSFNVEGAYSNTVPRVPDGVLPTKSDFRRLSFRLSYPLLRTRSDTLVLRGVFDIIEEEQVAPTFGNAVLYDDRYRALRAGFDWSHSFGETRTLLSFGGDISQGIRGLGSRGEKDATFDRPLSRAGADDVFTKGEVRARLVQPLPYDLGFELLGRGQYSFSGPLLNGERFSLGGARALSALDDGELTGDHGWLVRAELSYAAALLPPASTPITPYLFASRGQVTNDQPSILEAHVLGATNAGFGARTSIPLDESGSGAKALDINLEAARRFHDGVRQPDEWRFNIYGAIRF